MYTKVVEAISLYKDVKVLLRSMYVHESQQKFLITASSKRNQLNFIGDVKLGSGFTVAIQVVNKKNYVGQYFN